MKIVLVFLCMVTTEINEIIGEFEILEIQYKENEEIDSFAANFVQKCGRSSNPVFGSIRYNSSIPIEASFTEIFEEKTVPILFLVKYDPIAAYSESILITSRESTFCFQELPFGGNGIEISVDAENHRVWVLDFASPVGQEFKENSYKSAFRYPFQGSVCPGIEIATPEREFIHTNGEFEVLRLEKTEEGQIEALVLDFKVQNPNGEIIAGSITQFRSSRRFDSVF